MFVHFSQLIDSASGEQKVIVILRKNLIDELKNQNLSHDEARLQSYRLRAAFSNLVKFDKEEVASKDDDVDHMPVNTPAHLTAETSRPELSCSSKNKY